MILFIKNNFLNFIIAICALILLCIVLSFERKVAIDGDAKDYYSYLVSLFINHNFTHQVGDDWYLLQTPTGTINVHTIGVAVLTAPFFFIALLTSKIFGFNADGYSLPFQMGIYVAGIVYCTIGLIYLKKTLQLLQVKPSYIAALIVLCCFGTHLLNYAVNEPGMSHVYSFALTNILLYLVLKFVQTQTFKYVYLTALIVGFVIIVRPINILIVLFIPFFLNSSSHLLQTITSLIKSKHFYYSLLILIAVCATQSIAWYFQNKTLFQDSYVGNGFYFNNPQLFKMLFGFNNGLFIYVPLCLLLLVGIIPLFNLNKYKATVIIVFFIVIFYVFASYWAYNYFDGFGIRVFVDFLPIFILCGTYIFQTHNTNFKYTLTIVASVLLSFNLIQTYQYRFGIIKANGMNFEKYKYVFLKTNKAYADSIGGYNDLPLYTNTSRQLIFEDNLGNRTYNFYKQDTTKLTEYSVAINQANRFYALLEFERKETQKNSSYDGIFVFKATDSLGITNKSYNIFLLNETPSNTCCNWKKYTYAIATIGKFNKNDKLSLWVLNPKKATFSIKNLSIKIFDYSYTT